VKEVKLSQVSNQLDEGACIFGASILLNHVEALIQETAGVHAGEEDIEFIHRARVASRRLRAALPLFQSCLPSRKSSTWLKSIRNVTRALGEARDADVQIECVEAVLSQVTDEAYRPGIRRLLLRLRQKRAGLQPSVVSAMGSLIDAGILDQMRERFAAQAARKDSVYIYTPALYQHSFQSIVTRLDNLLSYDAIVAQPEKVTELHEMRICAKWLRYTMENFSTLYAGELKPYLQIVRKVQEMLGDIHDCDMWGELLPRFTAEERQRTQDYYGHLRYFRRLIPGSNTSRRTGARRAKRSTMNSSAPGKPGVKKESGARSANPSRCTSLPSSQLSSSLSSDGACSGTGESSLRGSVQP
jgi:CHAD domain-containing protein